MRANGGRTLGAILLLASCAAHAAVVSTYGGAGREPGLVAAPRPDGGRMLVGSTESFGSPGRDALVVAVDVRGDVLWAATYGGEGDDEAYGIVPWEDGWLVTGWTPSAGPSSRPLAWLGWIDDAGRLLEQVALDPAGLAMFSPLQAVAAPGGGVVAVSSVSVPGDHLEDAWIVRVDSDRTIAWERRIGGPQPEYAQAVAAAPDRILVGGAAPSLDGRRFTGWILDLGLDGATLSERGVHSPSGEADVGMRVAPATDGGVVLAGYDNESDGAFNYTDDAWAVKLDGSRGFAWGTHLAHGALRGTVGQALHEAEGGAWLVGGTLSGEDGSADGFVARLEASGDLAWQRRLGGGGDDAVTQIDPAAGGWLVSGRTASLGAGDEDWLVARVGAAGLPDVSCDFVGDSLLVGTHESWVVESLASPNRSFRSTRLPAALTATPVPVTAVLACETPRFRSPALRSSVLRAPREERLRGGANQ